MPSAGGPVLEFFAKLGMDSKEYDQGLKNAEKDAKGFGETFKTALSTAAKVGVAAFGVASAAVVKFGKEAVSSYAEYEQLVGGVQKLYGNAGKSLSEYAQSIGKTNAEAYREWQDLENAQNTVIKNAEQAYLTSGMSMNEYMETATSFSAALIKSLGGDTQKAAEVTDIAMRAMSDNVNTFGSNAEAVSNAFMGLSRQNYMMIDNLKLGYAGTAQGMLELINDSGVLNEKLTDTKQLAEVGFDKMIMAIQKVQEQQGIAGTTAREAMFTIEGSANATKAAWQNVITTIAKGEGLGTAIDNLSKAIFGDSGGGGLLNNLIPRVQIALEGIGDFVGKASPIIAKKIPELVRSLFPVILSSATTLLGSLAGAIPSLFEAVQGLIMNEGIGMVQHLSDGFLEGIPQFLSNVLPMVLSFVEGLRENAGTIVDEGINFVLNLWKGIMNGLPQLLAYIPQIIENLAGIINDNFPKILAAGWQLVEELGHGIYNAWPALVENFGNIFNALVAVVQAINWLALGSKIITLIKNGIQALATSVPNLLKKIATEGWEAIKKIDWIGIGKSIIDGIVAGIKSVGKNILGALSGAVTSAIDGVKGFLQIHSPSRLMRDEIGMPISEGIAAGIKKGSGTIYDAMADIPSITMNGYSDNSKGFRSDTAVGSAQSAGSVEEIAQLLRELVDKGLGITLVGDTGQLFKIVRKEDKVYKSTTGKSAFGY